MKSILSITAVILATSCLSQAAVTLQAAYNLGEDGWNKNSGPNAYNKSNSLVDLSGNNHHLVNWGGNVSATAPSTVSPTTSTNSIQGSGSWSTEGKTTDSENFSGLTKYVVRFDLSLTAPNSQELLSVNVANVDNTGSNGITLTTNAQGKLTLGKHRGATEAVASSFAMTQNTWTRVVMYVDNNNVSLYANGTEVLSNFSATNSTLTKFKFFAVDGGASNSTFSADELSVWSFGAEDSKESVLSTVNSYRAIPEPSAVGLLAGAGLFGLVALRRRK